MCTDTKTKTLFNLYNGLLFLIISKYLYTSPTGVADLLYKCHVCVECDSKYFDIVVVRYGVGANLYGHLVICVVFCREYCEFRLIFINLQRTSAHPVRYICNTVLVAGDCLLNSCCIVCTL